MFQPRRLGLAGPLPIVIGGLSQLVTSTGALFNLFHFRLTS